MKKILSLTSGIALSIALAACTAPQSTPGTSEQQHSMNAETTLQAYHWTLKTVAAKGQKPKAAPAHGHPL